MVRGSNSHEEFGQSGASTRGSALPRVAVFGPFYLRATERVLEKDGIRLKIGSRALDILVTLVERAPDVVIKRDLISRVWGNLVVDESSLRWHIGTLRKTLGDDETGNRYVTNVVGRGYCFATPVTWTAAAPAASESMATPAPISAPRLPRRPLRMVGRDGVVRDLTEQLRERRFVSIVGAGGIGKTTVALAVAHEVLSDFGGAVQFVDLASIENPQLVGVALASQLGLSVRTENPLAVILSFLRERRLLLVLDNCEHVIEAVATLGEQIFREAPRVHILATSRESLRAEGERVHHLSPLECPPPAAVTLTARQALEFPAVRLFVEQVAASGYPFELNDADAAVVADVCRRLDGIALALELAACRVGVYGVQRTASLLDKQFRLLWRGRRTALPRHQTLNATLDWSHNLLSDTERLTLRRLAVFVGAFSIEAAVDVVADDLDPAEVTEALATLVEKSLVALDTSTTMRYRLLDTTRAYAWQKLAESGEHPKIAARHGEHIAYVLERLKPTAAVPPTSESVNCFVEHLGNVRAALEWSFSEEGDPRIGVRLTGACAPIFFQLSLLPECLAWTERAMKLLDTITRGTRVELELQSCFGVSLMNTKGNVQAAHDAMIRALEIAESLQDVRSQLLLLHALYRFEMRSGDLRRLVDRTSRVEAVAKHIEDPVAQAIAHGVLACTHCLVGNNSQVPTHARTALSYPARSSRLNAVLYGYTHRVGARNVLARSLWMLGYADQAVEVAGQCLKEADDLGDPPSVVYALAWNVFVYLRAGDWQATEQVIERLMNLASKYGMSTYNPVAVGCQGWVAVLRGDPTRGIEQLRAALGAMRGHGYELHRGVFSGALAEGFAKAGQTEAAHATVCEALTWSETHGALADLPELLRIKGDVLRAMSPDKASDAEGCLKSSLEFARQQSARSLELCAATSLARLWAENGRIDGALELLAPIHGSFSEGLHTPILMAATKLLHELQPRT